MENHPIPQDITGFQFKLIGDMTVKQFAYIAAGVILGWLFFSIPLTGFIRYPLALLCIATGVSFAFLPLEGRPMDVMMYHFVKALFSPNQYQYQKIGGQFGILMQMPAAPLAQQQQQNTSSKKLEQYLQNLPHASKNKLDEKELVFFQSVASISAQPTPTVQPLPMAMAPAPIAAKPMNSPMVDVPKEPEKKAPEASTVMASAPTGPAMPPLAEKKEVIEPTAQSYTHDGPSPIEIKLREQAYFLQKKLQEAKEQEERQKQLGVTSVDHQKAEMLQEQMDLILKQKEALEDQLIQMSKKLHQQEKPQVYKLSEAQVNAETPNVRKISKAMSKSVGLPITSEFPNLLVGIVKDPRGNSLPNILVEVQDGDGNPVRAFKTNNLGQFASATPLLNGTYMLLFEDPQGKNRFDTVAVEATGDIISPIEVISTDAREQLRKELFG